MTTQSLIKRLAELQLKEQEYKVQEARDRAETARLQLEYTKRYLDAESKKLPPLPGASGLAS